jgi:4-amino-4-deoxy-L-arabinose transferase-like glycosyltransferase
MFQRFDHRLGHYLLLFAVGALLFLPNLGGPSLWDIDEGNNAEAAREMRESGNWIVPTFNFELRVDKPALLYWLQIGAYSLFGVNEFAARFPSAFAALLTILWTYELGRRMFNAVAGLLTGLMLATTILFSAAAHFANPDALLSACTVLTFLFFWNSIARGDRSWFVLCGISSGLAMLAKGPVGLLLPSTVALLFMLWSGKLRRLFDWRLSAGMLAFGFVTVPWYAWVGAETRGNYLKGFFLVHNVDRFLNPMEGHAGHPAYYLGVLLLGFAPWSAFLGLAVWYSFKFTPRQPAAPVNPATLARRAGVRESICFLWCWIVVYLLFFSFSRTKLPNYILPIYPAVALLSARFLDRWRRGEIQPPTWTMHAGPAGLALLGLGTGALLLMAGGVWPPAFLRGRHWPELQIWALLGIIPLSGAAAAWWCLLRGRRTGLIVSFAASGVLYLAALAAWGPAALDADKAPRELVRDLHTELTQREVRVAAFVYFQPSLVFYCQREVQKLKSEDETLEFLDHPLPVYLFVPVAQWEALEGRVHGSVRLLGRRHDLYQNSDVVVVTNR